MATRTLTELVLTYNNPNPKIQAALLASSTPEKFNRKGAQVDSARVLTDARKIIPTAADVFECADTDQRRLLAGIGHGMLCVCVDEWGRLESMWATKEGLVTGDRGVREIGTVSRADAHKTAMLARSGAVAALDCLAGQDVQRRLAVDVATGRADTEESLAQGLESLADLGRSWAADPDLVDLALDTGIDAAWADALENTARVLREAAESDTRRMTVQVTQAKLDYQDGVLLHLMGNLIRIFDVANNTDRRIPRLFPSSTYALFGRKRATDHAHSDRDAVDLPEVEVPESEVNGVAEPAPAESPTA